MSIRSILALSFSISLAIFIGCESDPLPDPLPEVNAPDSLTLYSIDGKEYPGKKPVTAETFHGVPVLGKVEVADPEKRKAIIAVLKKGLAESDGKMAKCFWPRHAIQLTENGRTIDFVICFECLQFQIHMDGSTDTKAITRSPQSELNKHLKAANVPLAPGMVKADD